MALFFLGSFRKSKTDSTRVKRVTNILYFNSLTSIPINSDYKSKITSFLEEIFSTDFRTPICRTACVPQQPNGYDCGIFMLKYIELLLNMGKIPKIVYFYHLFVGFLH